MDQKQRNKIAWGLAIFLTPILIYLLTSSFSRVASKNPPAAAPAAGVEIASPGVKIQPPAQPAGSDADRQLPPVDPKILAEQERIASLLPRNNPFNPLRPADAEPEPSAAISDAPQSPPPAKTATVAGIKLTAIVSRQGSTARMAMINGRFLGEGDNIAGWTIIKVNSRDVLLSNGSQQMVLRLK